MRPLRRCCSEHVRQQSTHQSYRGRQQHRTRFSNSQQRYGKCNCYFKPIACWPSCCVSQRTAVADFPLVLLHCTVSHFHPSTHTFTRSTRQSSPSGKASEFEFDILIPLTMDNCIQGDGARKTTSESAVKDQQTLVWVVESTHRKVSRFVASLRAQQSCRPLASASASR